MLIENEELLKAWITRDVEALCDADSDTLARYVITLVKKPLSDADLKALFQDKLKFFLQDQTNSFVDHLFQCIKERQYLPPQPITPEDEVEAAAAKEEPAAPSQQQLPPLPPPPPPQDDIVLTEESDLDEEEDYEEEQPKKLQSKVVEAKKTVPPSSSSTQGRRSDPSSASRTSTTNTRPIRRRISPPRSSKSPASALPPSQGAVDAKRGRYTGPISPVRNTSGGGGGRRGGRYGRRRSRSRSPTRSRSKSRSRSRSRSPTLQSYSSINRKDNSSSSASATTRRNRCRDFHEKGFCLRGDTCQYNHGTDPVVVENTTLEKIVRGGSISANPPPPGMEKAYGAGSEGYNPESPAMTAVSKLDFSVPPPPLPFGVAQPQMLVGMPPPVIFGRPPPQQQQMSGINGMYGQQQGTGGYPLIGTITGLSIVGQATQFQPHPNQTSMRGRGGTFHPQRGDSRFRPYVVGSRINPMLCSIIVKKIPPELNKIVTLDGHFSKFGQITNLHVQYQGEQDTALVTFKTRREATNAMKSTEPILNNRFIKVFWQTANEGGDEATAVVASGTVGGAGDAVASELPPKPFEPTNLNRPFSKTFAGGEEQGEGEAQSTTDTVSTPTEKIPLVAPAPTPIISRPAYNPRLAAAKLKADKANLLRLLDVQRMKANLMKELVDQQKEILTKLQNTEAKETKRKYMEAFKKLEQTVTTLKAEMAELTKSITTLQSNVESRKTSGGGAQLRQRVSEGTKIFHPATTNGKDIASSSATTDGATAADTPTTPTTPILPTAANKKKLFRVVQVSNIPPSAQEDLIVCMESFGSLFDIDIGGGAGRPCLFTYKQPMDAQKAVAEAASTFAQLNSGVVVVDLKVEWAPVSLGKDTVIPDTERNPGEQMTPAALLASIDSDGDVED